MRLVTYVHKGSTRIGAAKNDEIVDLHREAKWRLSYDVGADC